MIPFSILDLAPIVQGSTAAEAFRQSLDLAQHAERWGYHRFWLAEHHNMTGIASAATSVVIGYIAGGTRRIRVGAGGIMLPNHAPLVIAEQFGTLESLYPGRIDLGLGRAPGTDPGAARALGRDLFTEADTFPQEVQELLSYFKVAQPAQVVRAVPGAGLSVPVWLLGSSLFSAQLAAVLGLPFAFASHFAPDAMMPALEIYRRTFQPSEDLAEPYAMIGVNLVAAATDATAVKLLSSVQQAFVNLRRGQPGQLPPPVEDIERWWNSRERDGVSHALSVSAVGAPESVERSLASILDQTRADELILTGQIYDHAARLRSFELAAHVLRGMTR